MHKMEDDFVTGALKLSYGRKAKEVFAIMENLQAGRF